MNKISRDLNPNNNGYTFKSQHNVNTGDTPVTNPSLSNDETIKASLDYIGMINCPSINPRHNSRVQKSVREFLDDPELVEEKLSLQDDLIKRGYHPSDAIEKTELFFKALKDGRTYKN